MVMRQEPLAAVVVGVLAASGGWAVAHAVSSVSSPKFGVARLVASIDTPAFLQEVGAADLTGDGNSDVVVTRIVVDHAQLEPISILVGDGHGRFRDETTQLFNGPVPTTMYARRTVFADFNGDGRKDVLIADTGFDSSPFPGYPNTLILSAPGGKLVDASANLPRQPDFTHSAAVGDVDGNDAVDIYLGNLSGGTSVPPEILLNDGTGHFRISPDALPADLTAPSAPHYDGSALVDVNGDGSPDLVLAGSPGTSSRVLLNDGVGHFHDLANALPAKPWGIDSEGLAISSVDLNGDSHLDLLIAYTKNNPFYKGRWIQVLINNGDGTFRDETSTRLPQTDNLDEWPYAIQVADLNGDGKPDIAVSLYWYPPESPPIYLNSGDGTFAALPRDAFKSQPPAMFTLLDANNDGLPDIFGAPWRIGGAPEQHYLIEQLPPLPGVVTNVSASRGAYHDRVHLTWHAVRHADHYEIWRAVGSARTRIATTQGTSLDDRRCRRDVRYRYSIRAVNVAGTGPFSTPSVGFRR
jgi:FG-GAP-like repeat